MPTVTTLNDVFLTKIKSLYYVELQLEKALPLMAENAASEELKQAFSNHHAETVVHIERLEKVFQLIGEQPVKTTVEGIKGIVADGEWIMKEVDGDEILKDTMLSGGARYSEHYEMAGYMTALELAQALGLDPEVSELLSATLAEEKAADAKLVEIGRMLSA